jgi:hypothetical protein
MTEGKKGQGDDSSLGALLIGIPPVKEECH